MNEDYPLVPPASSREITVPVAYTDLAAAAVTAAFNTLLTIPTGAIITGFCIRVATAFTGGSISTYVAKFGSSGTADFISGDLNLFTTGNKVSDTLPGAGIVWPGGTLRVNATASHNTNTATAGQLYVTIFYYTPR